MQCSNMTNIGFVADAVIAWLRRGSRPTDEEAGTLDQLPFIDLLRTRVIEDDVQWLLAIVEKESGSAAALCASLLGKYCQRADVQQRLFKRWETSNSALRARLLWRLLDDPDLPEVWQRRLFDFVLGEWDIFREVTLRFFGSAQTLISQVLKRMACSPDRKKWVYLCCFPEMAEDQEAARGLLNLARLSTDPFTREVSHTLLERFFPVRE